MIPRLPILVVDPNRHTGTPTEEFVAFVKAVVEIFEDETSDFRTSAEVNPNNGSAKLFAWTKNRNPIEIETAREIAERIHSLVLAETGYAPGEVHVDAFCILRGFPEDRLWDGSGTRLSSGQPGLMSSGVRARR